MAATSPRIKRYEGQTFGQLTIVHEYRDRPGHGGNTRCKARCSCGHLGDYQRGNVLRGATTRCATCRANAPHHNRTHGRSRTHLYVIWATCKRNGRLCRDWQVFTVFAAAVGEPPEGHGLRPLDSRCPLGPGNWKWGWKTRPGRSVNPLVIDGRTYSQSDAARLLGVSRQWVHYLREHDEPKLLRQLKQVLHRE